MSGADEFDRVATRQRDGLASDRRDDRRLIRCATLAASSHNTQPWTYVSGPNGISIRADLTRRCAVVDPDDAHLFKSLGCATENLVLAAGAQGLVAEVRFDERHDAVDVDLEPSPSAEPSELFDAIGRRQCTRLAFDSTPVAADDVAALERAGTGRDVRTVIVTEGSTVGAIAELVTRGNVTQLTDRAFRRELVSWIRFNPSAALRTGDGLAGRCSGNPSLPTWLGRLLAPLVIRSSRQAARDEAHIQSSAGIAVVVSERDDKLAWIEAGRAYQRLALAATLLDIRTAFVNQPVEVPALRRRLEDVLGLGGERAQLAVRFGHGAPAPYSLRRPLDEVIAT